MRACFRQPFRVNHHDVVLGCTLQDGVGYRTIQCGKESEV